MAPAIGLNVEDKKRKHRVDRESQSADTAGRRLCSFVAVCSRSELRSAARRLATDELWPEYHWMRAVRTVVGPLALISCCLEVALAQPSVQRGSVPITRLRTGPIAYSTYSGIVDSMRA